MDLLPAVEIFSFCYGMDMSCFPVKNWKDGLYGLCAEPAEAVFIEKDGKTSRLNLEEFHFPGEKWWIPKEKLYLYNVPDGCAIVVSNKKEALVDMPNPTPKAAEKAVEIFEVKRKMFDLNYLSNPLGKIYRI